MKRRAFIVLMISVMLLLCGCSRSEEKAFLSFAETVSNAESIACDAHVTAEYDMISAEFDLDYSYSDGESVIEVVKPELIKGIKARVKDGETKLEYEGAILDIGTIGDTWISPMSSLPIMLNAIKESHLELAWDENDMLVVRLVPEDDTTVTVWINADTLTPENAEITYNEKTAIFIDIKDWEVN